MNKVFLLGRTTRDIELRHTQSGKSVADFTIAVDRIPEGSDFIRCVAWEKEAELLSRYVKKGNRVALVCHLQTRTVEKDGNKQYITDVIVERSEFLETRTKTSTSPTASTFVPVEDSDEELPF